MLYFFHTSVFSFTAAWDFLIHIFRETSKHSKFPFFFFPSGMTEQKLTIILPKIYRQKKSARYLCIHEEQRKFF